MPIFIRNKITKHIEWLRKALAGITASLCAVRFMIAQSYPIYVGFEELFEGSDNYLFHKRSRSFIDIIENYRVGCLLPILALPAFWGPFAGLRYFTVGQFYRLRVVSSGEDLVKSWTA